MQLILKRFPVIKSPLHQTLLAFGCVGLFVVPALYVRVTSHRSEQSLTWRAARNIAPESLIETAIRQNSVGGGVEPQNVKVLPIPDQGKGALYVFDFQSPQLCGAVGCVYPVYQESGQQVLSAIANPNLPKGEVLFKVDDTVRNGFSCLVVTQSTPTEGMVSRSQYCYQGTGFVRVNEALTQVGQDFNWGVGK